MCICTYAYNFGAVYCLRQKMNLRAESPDPSRLNGFTGVRGVGRRHTAPRSDADCHAVTSLCLDFTPPSWLCQDDGIGQRVWGIWYDAQAFSVCKITHVRWFLLRLRRAVSCPMPCPVTELVHTVVFWVFIDIADRSTSLLCFEVCHRLAVS